MYHSRDLDNKNNNIHKRALRIAYQEKKSNLQDLLQKDNSASIHMKNLQYLATEIYKVKNDLSQNNERGFHFWQKTKITILGVAHMLWLEICIQNILKQNTVTNLGSKLWKRLPDEIKNASQLSALKYRIKIWTTDNYPIRFCKIFVKNLEVCPNI